jgi:hypothetical protein
MTTLGAPAGATFRTLTLSVTLPGRVGEIFLDFAANPGQGSSGDGTHWLARSVQQRTVPCCGQWYGREGW